MGEAGVSMDRELVLGFNRVIRVIFRLIILVFWLVKNLLGYFTSTNNWNWHFLDIIVNRLRLRLGIHVVRVRVIQRVDHVSRVEEQLLLMTRMFPRFPDHLPVPQAPKAQVTPHLDTLDMARRVQANLGDPGLGTQLTLVVVCKIVIKWLIIILV